MEYMVNGVLMKALNIKIPAELHQRLKVQSVITGKTMTDLAIEYIDRGLNEDKELSNE